MVGDDVFVGAGTFAGGITMADGVSLYGTGADQTTLSGGGPVVTASGLGEGETIAGFTITGGSSEIAGGIYCYGSSPLIKNNTIVGNTVEDGGIQPMREYWERILNRAEEEAPKVKEETRGASDRIKERAEERQREFATQGSGDGQRR